MNKAVASAAVLTLPWLPFAQKSASAATVGLSQDVDDTNGDDPQGTSGSAQNPTFGATVEDYDIPDELRADVEAILSEERIASTNNAPVYFESPVIDGVPVTAVAETNDDSLRSTFQGVEGESLFFHFTDVDYPSCAIFVTHGVSGVDLFFCHNDPVHEMDPLPATGEYGIHVLGNWDDDLREGGSVTMRLSSSSPTVLPPQMMHHNIYGNVMHEGDDYAVRELKDATTALGYPLAYSLNEVCVGQALELQEWLQETNEIPYSMTFAQHFSAPGSVCTHDATDEGPYESGQFGVALLTKGAGHESGAFVAEYEGYPGEQRVVACMPAGVTGSKGYACTTHLQGGTFDCVPPDPTPTTTVPGGCDDGQEYPKYGQFADYYGHVQNIRTFTGLPVHFAGDFYIAAEDLTGIGGFSWENYIPADGLARPTQFGREGDPDHLPPSQADHIIHEVGQPKFREALLRPADEHLLRRADLTPGNCFEREDTTIARGYMWGGHFCSDHSLIVSYVGFE